MSSRSFLMEIGTEELPPGSLPVFLDHLRTGFARGLGEASLTHGDIQGFITPRRLAVLISNLADRQTDQIIERKGPAVSAAWDENGQPTKAALGFARSCGVDVSELETEEGEKGAWLIFRSQRDGLPAEAVLPSVCEAVLNSLPVARRMKWSDQRDEFVRPVHWVVMMLDDTVVEGSLVGKLAGNLSRGHRFMTPGDLPIKTASDYESTLHKHKVIASFEKRRQLIKEQLQATADKAGGSLVCPDQLLDEVSSLVEWPITLKGVFDASFLKVPDEALISAMSKHQKYFHMVNNTGALLPLFLTVSNIESSSPMSVVEGNQRVLKARLADARFFYEQDCRVPLEQRLPLLSRLVFQDKLGDYQQKSGRIADLAAFIAVGLGGSADEQHQSERAGLLCKADLLTDMVGEFPDLQGVMGGYYARAGKEVDALATAISEHYRPGFAGDPIPLTLPGRCVSLADRLDTLVGLFGIGQPPSGSRDPFALRRAAYGVIRILLESPLSLDILAALDKAASNYETQGIKLDNKAVENVHPYLLDRTEFWYQENQIPIDVFRAVRASNDPMHNLLDTHEKVLALSHFRSNPQAPALVEVNKRVANILRSADSIPDSTPDQELFEHDSERALFNAVTELEQKIVALIGQSDYPQVFEQLASLQQLIDTYFDDVMVMVDNSSLRDNRLATLFRLRQLFLLVADLSVMQF